MDSGRIFFDPSCHGNMLFMGNADNLRFRGMNMEETSKKRPLFTTSEEFYDEEYFDEQVPEKKRRLTPEQVHMLEKSFETDNKLEPDRKTQLAKSLGLQPRQVAVWFQNRRARWKTKQLERDYDELKASFDALRSDYDAVFQENDNLKAELISLREKLQPAGEPGQKQDPLPAEALPPVKVEDRLSTGSDGSAVVDEDCRQLLDSGDSYFPEGDYMPEVDGEEEDVSGDGRRYFSDVFGAEQQEQMGWCIWS